MILRLRGPRALSDFRLAKLLQSLPVPLAQLTLHAEFWHFVEVTRALSAAELERLERLLIYGPATGVDAAQGTDATKGFERSLSVFGRSQSR